MKTTQLEVDRMIAGGMILISSRELVKKLDELDYKISESDSFFYQNKLNKIHYAAKHVSIVHKCSGKSFANIDSSKEKLKELQEIRSNFFVFENGRVWEL